MARETTESTLDFFVLDDLKTGDEIVVNDIMLRRTHDEREYNEPSQTYSYDFNSLGEGKKYRIHVKTQFESDISLGLRHDQKRQKRKEGWLVDVRAGEGQKIQTFKWIK